MEEGRGRKPCTCTLQFLARGVKLDLIVYMRSNDVIKGLPHDIFCFTMLQEIAARRLSLEPGIYKHCVGSLHLYSVLFAVASESPVGHPVKVRRRPRCVSISLGYSSRFYLSHKFLQQRRRIVLLPDQVKREPHFHIYNRDQGDATGTVPAHGFGLPREPNPALDKT